MTKLPSRLTQSRPVSELAIACLARQARGRRPRSSLPAVTVGLLVLPIPTSRPGPDSEILILGERDFPSLSFDKESRSCDGATPIVPVRLPGDLEPGGCRAGSDGRSYLAEPRAAITFP